MFSPPFTERSNVHLMPAWTIAILALSKISRQFNYLLLKLDKYFLAITLQRPSEHTNCLTLEMTHITQLFILIYRHTDVSIYIYILNASNQWLQWLPLWYMSCASDTFILQLLATLSVAPRLLVATLLVATFV